MGRKLVNYDDKSDVLYIGIKKGVEEEFVEVAPGVNVEINERGEVIGIEMLNTSKFLKSVIKPIYKQAEAKA
jgi:uncharacterized protein YuzE